MTVLRAATVADDDVELQVYDVIGEDLWSGGGVTAKMAARAVAQARQSTNKRLRVRLNSPGGDAFEGVAIYNILANAGDVHVKMEVEGLAASACSVIAMAGDEIWIGHNAFFMIHEGWGMTVGPAADHEQTAALLRKLNFSMADTYARRTGMGQDSVLELMAAETWLAGQEAVDMGFADGLLDAKTKPAANAWSPTGMRLLAACKRMPTRFADAIRIPADARPAASLSNRSTTRTNHFLKSSLGEL